MSEKKYNELKTQISSSIELIKNVAKYYEVAHSYEDSLREFFLEILVKNELNKAQIKELAILVLSTKNIEFPRYTA